MNIETSKAQETYRLGQIYNSLMMERLAKEMRAQMIAHIKAQPDQTTNEDYRSRTIKPLSPETLPLAFKAIYGAGYEPKDKDIGQHTLDRMYHTTSAKKRAKPDKVTQ